MQESIEVKQLRSRLGSYLNQVREGLTVVVTRQGQAIAEIRPAWLRPSRARRAERCIARAIGRAAGRSRSYGRRNECSRLDDLRVPNGTGESYDGSRRGEREGGRGRKPRASHAGAGKAQEQAQEQAQESQPELAIQTEMTAAVEAESAGAVSPPPAKAAKRVRPSRSRTAKTAASPKRRQSRGTSARKKSS